MLLKFFVYSILGCMLEGIWCLIKTGKIKSRRMLLGLPMCPVYGVGGVLMPLFLANFRNNILLLYVTGAILASCVELIFFALGSLMFDIRLWDYSDKPYTIAGGVCGEYSVWWGLVAVVLVQYIDPAVSRVLSAINPYTTLVITVFLCVVTLADAIKTADVLKRFKTGSIEKLPDCFWYMEKNS